MAVMKNMAGMHRTSRRRSRLGGLVVALGLLAGCSRQEPPSEYQAFTGVVKALDMETGEVFIRSDRVVEGWRPGRDIPCVVTKDSEVYIDDRFSEIGELQTHDFADVVGYRDKDHFVVSFLTVTRPSAAAPPPPLSAGAVATRPTPEK